MTIYVVKIYLKFFGTNDARFEYLISLEIFLFVELFFKFLIFSTTFSSEAFKIFLISTKEFILSST